MKCWEERGCDEEWQSRCPHNTPGEYCPADCYNTHCTRPTYERVEPLDALMNPEYLICVTHTYTTCYQTILNDITP